MCTEHHQYVDIFYLHTLVFNRVHGIDEEKMLQKISLYERDNRTVILENKAKRDTEMRSTEQRIEEELMLRKDLARSIKVLYRI